MTAYFNQTSGTVSITTNSNPDSLREHWDASAISIVFYTGGISGPSQSWMLVAWED